MDHTEPSPERTTPVTATALPAEPDNTPTIRLPAPLRHVTPVWHRCTHPDAPDWLLMRVESGQVQIPDHTARDLSGPTRPRTLRVWYAWAERDRALTPLGLVLDSIQKTYPGGPDSTPLLVSTEPWVAHRDFRPRAYALQQVGEASVDDRRPGPELVPD